MSRETDYNIFRAIRGARDEVCGAKRWGMVVARCRILTKWGMVVAFLRKKKKNGQICAATVKKEKIK